MSRRKYKLDIPKEIDFDSMEMQMMQPDSKLDLSILLLFQMHECQKAFNTNNLTLIESTVRQFERMIGGRRSTEFFNDKDELTAEKDKFIIDQAKNIKYNPRRKAEIEIELNNRWLKYYYGELFELLIALCDNLGYFGYINVAQVISKKKK